MARQLKIAVIVGVPGVGKTTVLNSLKNVASKAGLKIKIVNFGDYMFKSAVRSGLIKHRDEIRRLNLSVQTRLQEEAAKTISEEGKKLKDLEILIVDTHALIHTPNGFWPGLPLSVIGRLRPVAIFIVEAEPKEILKRRVKDPSRFRLDERSVEEIKEFMNLVRIASISSAILSGAIVKIVANREGKAEEAALEILKTLTSL